MNPWPVDAEVDEVHLPRPGHADLAGDPEVRPHRRAQRARARVGARDRRAGGGRRRSPRRSCATLGVEVRSHVTRIGTVDGARARATCGPADFEGVDESPVRCLDAAASDAMVAEIDAARKANESLGGEFEVMRLRARAGDRLARLLGGAPRRAAGAGDHVDPGDEGRGHRRRLRRSPAGWARRPTTRSSGRTSEGYYRETNRAGRHRGRHDHRRPASWSAAR